MKTTFIEKDLHDDPVGNWHLCTNCNEEVFIPNYATGASQNIKFCPYCGAEIMAFQKEDEDE
ncbi:MAG: hypothetical protein WC554_09755 [Clostridia bacterium]